MDFPSTLDITHRILYLIIDIPPIKGFCIYVSPALQLTSLNDILHFYTERLNRKIKYIKATDGYLDEMMDQTGGVEMR